METSKGAVAAMVLTAVALFGFGASQFGGLFLTAGEHEHEDEGAEYGHAQGRAIPMADRSVLEGLAARYDARIKEVEREGGLIELERVGADGEEMELMVDPATGEVEE